MSLNPWIPPSAIILHLPFSSVFISQISLIKEKTVSVILSSFEFIVIPKDPAFEKSQSAHTTIQDKRVRAKKETLESISNLAQRLM